MNLTSLQIQCALEYAPCKNVEGLHKALNEHMGVKVKYEKVRSIVVGGVNGGMGEIVAYELGLNDNYIPVLKKANRKKIKTPRTTYKSKYKGVSWNHRVGKWQGQITIKGDQKHLGYSYDDKVLALRYNAIAVTVGRKLNEVSE